MTSDAADPGPGAGPPDGDRRAMPRYPAAIRRAWLGWRPDGRDFCAVPSWFLDIGLGGCQVATPEPVPGDRAVLVRLDGDLLPVWYEARLLDYREHGPGAYLARLGFPDGCPYELFLAVAFGFVGRDAARCQGPLPGSQAAAPARDDARRFRGFGRAPGS